MILPLFIKPLNSSPIFKVIWNTFYFVSESVKLTMYVVLLDLLSKYELRFFN